MMNNLFPKIHKEGYKFLAISLILTFLSWLFLDNLVLLFILLTIWVYYFFRDPERVSIMNDNYLVSPADGVITQIIEVDGPKELNLERENLIE